MRMNPTSDRTRVLIVGAGLAGLSCAVTLVREGCEVQLLEASDGVGGRVRTDTQDGFLLDRGFQVLLPSYPEARKLLDYEELKLESFYSGALVRVGGRFHRIADPFQHPVDALINMLSPTSSLQDKLRIAELRRSVMNAEVEDLFLRKETTTASALKARGFSPAFIEHFFRPFLGGVFLERELSTSSRMFEFVFRMFAEGGAALPALGMSSIPEQLALKLPNGTIRLGRRAEAVDSGVVVLDSGERLEADAVVLAVDAALASKLLGQASPPAQRSAVCLYFRAEEPPIQAPILVLNGEGRGPINNLCIPSQVAPMYAPPDASLVSVSVVGHEHVSKDASSDNDETLLTSVKTQLVDWFGEGAARWQHLRTYRIAHAFPEQSRVSLCTQQMTRTQRMGVYVCGDYLDTSSINGALRSGRLAAETLLEDKTHGMRHRAA